MSGKSFTFPQETKIQYYNYTGLHADYKCSRKFKMRETIKSCYECKKGYNLVYETHYYVIFTSKVPEFEAIFPVFPYVRDEYKMNKIEQKINETNDRIDKLVSHIETLMIALGHRPASSDNLII